jgi:hypothetical protein
MKTMTELLHDADPVLHEPITSLEQRDYVRNAMLAAASGEHSRFRPGARSSVAPMVVLGFAVIVVLFLAERMLSPFASNVYAAVVQFELKLAEDKPAAGLRESKVPGTDGSVYLHSEDIVTNIDISRAYIIQPDRSSQYNVGVEFTSSGAEKIRAATAKNIGKKVAILLDGQVVMAATIRAPIGKSAVISGDLSRPEAERIVKGITTTR